MSRLHAGRYLLVVLVALGAGASPGRGQDPAPLPATEQVQVLKNGHTARSAQLLVNPANPQILYMTTEFTDGETGGGNIGQGATADDFDGDFHDNCTDCAPADRTAFEPPPEVANVTFTTDPDTLSWKKLHPGPRFRDTYDIVRGELAGLPVGPDDEICLESDYEPNSYADASDPDPGAGFFYLVRGRNVCGVGAYGADSASRERSTSACP